jgi:hypothetical protein
MTHGPDVDPKFGTPQQYALKHTWTDPDTGEAKEEYFGPWWKDHTVDRSQKRRTLNSPPGHEWSVCVLQHTDILDKGLRGDTAGAWTVEKKQVTLRPKNARSGGRKKPAA